MLEFWREILGIANVFIGLFVLAFAILFLKKTAPMNDRKPWVILFIAVIVFFFFQLCKMIGVFSFGIWPELSDFLQTLFIGLVLYVFIFQFHLMHKQGRIIVKSKNYGKKLMRKKV
ncbi:hypothetical protein K9L97_00885 [Candidatus Woesearchaeota archaeon]|nr:hypothetical protein [Candidatus Woesearchaeota archaeon]